MGATDLELFVSERRDLAQLPADGLDVAVQDTAPSELPTDHRPSPSPLSRRAVAAPVSGQSPQNDPDSPTLRR